MVVMLFRWNPSLYSLLLEIIHMYHALLNLYPSPISAKTAVCFIHRFGGVVAKGRGLVLEKGEKTFKNKQTKRKWRFKKR